MGNLLRAAAIIVGLAVLGRLYVASQGSSHAPPLADTTEAGAVHIKGGPVLACTNKDDLDRVQNYLVRGERAAALKAIHELVGSNLCTMLADREKVIIEHVGLSDSVHEAVRRPGEMAAYWMTADHIGQQ